MALRLGVASLQIMLLVACAMVHSTQGLDIEVVVDGEPLKRYSDSNAAFEGRSYQFTSKPLMGVLMYPNPKNACSMVEAPPRNGGYIAYLEEYTTCQTAETNIYTAGFKAMVAFTSFRNIVLSRDTVIPQALFFNESFDAFLRKNVLNDTSYSNSTVIKIWDDAYEKLEKLFIIFGSILLAAVLLSIFIFCCSLFCRVILYKWRTRGLSTWQVRSIPKRKYHKDKETCETCSICLEEFKEGETIRVLPCEHVFHPKCVDEWLQKWNRNCPLCKSTIKRSGGRNNNPPARTDDNEASHLLANDEHSSNEDDADGGDPGSYGATGFQSPLLLSSGSHRRSASSSTTSSIGNGRRHGHVTSTEIDIELNVTSSREGSRSPPPQTGSNYQTPQQTDDDDDATPSFVTANGSQTSSGFLSVRL